ncbi:hypothetical protein DTL42_21410 [Bremerella cremea]|uniref:Tim44-like domain-containing protein n=1 Tax=Bremerella cremea TaxID=1031537 RepID=A0A368KM97_9BACT|nr:TIM44-like domain-containing protein [Bremerella cremea]RCS41135.1 hypothetical protein DTL42_21410 [Bremerella cremea]
MAWFVAENAILTAASGIEAVVFAVVTLVILTGLASEHLRGELWELATIKLGSKKARLSQMEQALDAIQEADPNFDLETFCKAATNAFVTVENAIDEGDLAQIRAFVSDGIYQRFAFRLDEEVSLGRSRRTEKLTLSQVAPVEISSAKNTHNAFEVISLRFNGRAMREYRMQEGTAEIAVDVPEEISEVWTFLRRRGAKTKSKDFGSVKGQCPNCGADVSVNQWEKCPSCESTVRSGEHDWVLSEISDQSSWRITKPFKMSSATRYWIKQDHGFSSHYLEDRASVIFFRKFLTDRLGSIDALGKVATDRFCEAYEKKLEPDTFGNRTIYLEPRILAADVSGVIAEEPYDKALMHIRWTARRGIDRSGQIVLEKEPVQNSTMMVLVRKHGVKTRIERTITSSHCPKCGAPESNNASHACEFCQTVLNDGALEWTLADMLPFTSTEAMALRKKAYEGISTKVTVSPAYLAEDVPLKRAVVVEQAMPQFTKSEIEGVQIDGHAPNVLIREDDVTLCRVLIDLSRQLQLPKAKTHAFIRLVAKECQVSNVALAAAAKDRQPLDRSHLLELNAPVLKYWLQTLINVALLDAQFEAWEKVFVFAAAKELGLSSYDVEAAIRARMLELDQWTSGMRSVDMFSWVVVVAAADGRFDPQEIEQLKQLADRYGISRSQLTDMCQAAINKQLIAQIPQDANIAQVWLVQMIDMAFADGTVCRAEQKVLAKMAERIGFTPYDLKHLIRRRRAVLYKQARNALNGKPPAEEDELVLKADWSD